MKQSLRDLANKINIDAFVPSPDADPGIRITRDEQLSMVHGLKLGAYNSIREVLLTSQPGPAKLARITQIMQSASDGVASVLRRTPSD